jgi:hypothetical protein
VEPVTAERSWLGRGTFSPSPWGRTMHAILKETSVEFLRPPITKDNTGAFKGGKPATYMTLWCHVDLQIDPAGDISKDNRGLPGTSIAPIQRRNYLIMVDLADVTDPALYPKQFDRARFTDQLGVTRDLKLINVDAPGGQADHIEIQTEDFE